MMPYHKALALILLQHHSSAISAFQALPLPTSTARHSKQSSALQTSSALESIPTLESILDDGKGNINSNLAQAIYEWEVAHNGQQQKINDQHQQFSTRDGLRLVDELVREILSSLSENNNNNNNNTGSHGNGNGHGLDNSDISYNDLVQEGMIALLRAMSSYDSYKLHTTATTVSTFQGYAKHTIQTSLLHFLAHSSRPIRLPLSLQTTLQTANIAAEKLRKSSNKEPTLVQVAKEAQIAPEQLALYRKLYRSMVSRVGTFVSMEDGMEVYDPTLAGVGVGTGLRSRSRRDDVDVDVDNNAENSNNNNNNSMNNGEEGIMSRRGGDNDNNNDNISQDDDNLTQLNSQEDDWTRQPPERIVTPLKDILTDTEEINNPLSYTHHFILNEELNEFLDETLTEEELTVIQLRFGLVDSKYGGKGWTANEIGVRMGMEREDVVKVASGALEKLRKGALTNWEEDNDATVEISL